MFLGNLKDLIVPKYQDSTISAITYSEKKQYLFQQCVFLCFMDLGISKIYQDFTILLFRFCSKRSEIPIDSDPSET